jgi:hypothetical protein
MIEKNFTRQEILSLILVLVGKSLGNINCLLACLLVCPYFPAWSKEHRENLKDNFNKILSKGS